MGHARKRMLSVFLTTKCNLRCTYCYTHKEQHSHQTIPWEFAKSGIDTFMTEEFPPHIRFFGAGEPTMELALMRRIVDYARDTTTDGRKLTVELQTNGAFSAATAKYLADEVDIIWVSCDGLPPVQDFFRPTASGAPSSPLLERNVRFLTSNGRGMTGIRVTITERNVESQVEMLEYFASLGVSHVWADPIFPSIGGRPDGTLNIMEFAEGLVAAQETAARLGMTYGSILTCNFDEAVEYQCRACLPTPHLTTDGYVSACDMALFGLDDNHMSGFIYGKWNADDGRISIDDRKIEALRRRSGCNMPECRGCTAVDHCAGYCLGEVANEAGDMFGRKERVCAPIRYLLDHMPKSALSYEYPHP